ncbi:MAG: hypothetical protein QF645_03635, partial [Planctomycetota bacterium]|nr:hypothetical protein [Planctomycetota bacterium]
QLAQKAEEKAEKITLLKMAVRDFEESIQRGLPSSKPLLEKTRADLAELSKPDPENPPEPTFSEADFRPGWEALIKQKNYSGALAYVKKGKDLPKELRESYLSETENRCRQMIAESVQAFQTTLEKNLNLTTIRKMNRFVFDRNFSLPTKETLIAPPPVYLWSLSVRETLSQYREGKEILEDLFRLAIEAIPLSAQSNHPRFLAMEHFTQEILRGKLASIESSVREALQPERERRKREASHLKSQWDTFEKQLAEKTKGRSKTLVRLKRPNFDILFPIDWKGKEEITSQIIASAREKNPDLALKRIALTLSKIQKEGVLWEIESRWSIIRLQIVVGALLGELAGKSVAEITTELKELGLRLKRLGGGFEEQEFGPKVARVFEVLGKS